MKQNIYKSLTLIAIITFIMGVTNFSFADNDEWAGQAISDFLYNDVDAPDVLDDEKYIRYITRKDFAQLIVACYVKSEDIKKDQIILSPNIFVDTDSVDVQQAYSLGLINGKSYSTYCPDDYITREEVATIIIRFLNIKDIDTNSKYILNNFEDKHEISSWAYEALAYCSENKIIVGTGIYMEPKSNATTQEVIIMLHRILIKYKWISETDNIYINTFRIPNDTMIDAHNLSDEDLFVQIEWEKINDYEKLEKDLFYTLNSKFENSKELSDVVNNIMSTENIYVDNTLNINDYIIKISSTYSYSYIHIYKQQ